MVHPYVCFYLILDIQLNLIMYVGGRLGLAIRGPERDRWI